MQNLRSGVGWGGESSYEIIRIADARSICEGYNRGLAKARGELILFSHDDIEILSPDFKERLLGHMSRFDVVGIAGTTKLIGPAWHLAAPPHVFGQVAMQNSAGLRVAIYCASRRAIASAQALDGVFISVRRNVLNVLAFDEEIPGFHVYDIDFSYRAFRAGFKIGIACDLDLLHRGEGDYGTPEWKAAALVFLRKHRAVLPPEPKSLIPWQPTTVNVNSAAEAAAVMRPHYFDSDAPG